MKTDKIYNDFSSHEFGSVASIQQAKGGHNTECQDIWNKRVAQSIAEIVDQSAASSDFWFDEGDKRPKLFDEVSGTWCLVDTGASLSIWPQSNFAEATPDKNKALQAVNGSTIDTFGTRTIKVTTHKM